MIESSSKNAEDLTFACPVQETFASKKTLPPRMFSTVSWFYELKLGLGVDTLVAVQRAIEPVPPEKAVAVGRRWGDYKNGKHKPLVQVVQLAEKHVPGSEAIFKSLLWDALQLEKSEVGVARALLGETSIDGDELLLCMLDQKRIAHAPGWLRKRCRVMVTHGTLEGLAVLTVCMRLAGRTRAAQLALKFYRHATDCLMILGSWFYLHGIAQAIAEYYEKTLLPFCSNEHKLGTFSAGYYLHSIQVLAKSLLAVEGSAGRELTHEERISMMLALMGR